MVGRGLLLSTDEGLEVVYMPRAMYKREDRCSRRYVGSFARSRDRLEAVEGALDEATSSTLPHTHTSAPSFTSICHVRLRICEEPHNYLPMTTQRGILRRPHLHHRCEPNSVGAALSVCEEAIQSWSSAAETWARPVLSISISITIPLL